MKKIIAAIIILAASGCTVGSITDEYVAADESTYKLVAPVLKGYLDADESVTPEEHKAWDAKFTTWKSRITRMKAKLAETKPAEKEGDDE